LSTKVTLQNDKIHIGWLGRFSGTKGAWDFIKIAGALNLLFPNLVFHMLAPLPDDKDVELIDGSILLTGVYLNTLIQTYQLQKGIGGAASSVRIGRKEKPNIRTCDFYADVQSGIIDRSSE
jgi:hypothetical protein